MEKPNKPNERVLFRSVEVPTQPIAEELSLWGQERTGIIMPGPINHFAEVDEAKVVFGQSDRKPVTWQEHLDHLKDQQARLERMNKSSDYARVDITSQLPIGVVATGDWHLYARGTDYATWEKHMKLIKDTPNVFMIPHGNTIDNFIFPSGMFEQMGNPSEQIEMVKSFANDFKDKFLAVVGSRCHEGWTDQRTDVNIYEQMFTDTIDQGTPFFGNGGVVEINLNGIAYRWGAIHKSRYHSSLNPTNLNRQLHDLRWPVDILSGAHHHVAQLLQGVKYEPPFEKDVIFIRTGTYKGSDNYSEGEGFGKGQLASPMVILDPARKHMIAFYYIEDGVNYLNMQRELAQFKLAQNAQEGTGK